MRRPLTASGEDSSRFTVNRAKRFLRDLGIDTLFREPDNSNENRYVGLFTTRMHDEFLDGGLFLHINETKYIVEHRRMDYNQHRHISPKLCRRVGCARPHTPMLNGVRGCGILITGTRPIEGDRSVVNDENQSR